MSGINCGIYPIGANDEAETIALEQLEANAVLLDTILTNEEQISNNLNVVIPALESQADVLLAELSDATNTISNFETSGAMGAYVSFFNNSEKDAVSTPTTIANIDLTISGTYLVAYSFYVGTNTANGGVTPLTNCNVYIYLNGVAIPNMPLIYYPQSALRNKQTFDIAVSGLFPIFISGASTLEILVNNAPENVAYGTFCAGRTLSAICVSPYLPA